MGITPPLKLTLRRCGDVINFLPQAAFHLGPLCDPDTRAPEPLLADIHKYVVPFLKEKFGGAVKTDAPALAEGCMYSMTPDEVSDVSHALSKVQGLFHFCL